jgi:hypothetical protein
MPVPIKTFSGTHMRPRPGRRLARRATNSGQSEQRFGSRNAHAPAGAGVDRCPRPGLVVQIGRCQGTRRGLPDRAARRGRLPLHSDDRLRLADDDRVPAGGIDVARRRGDEADRGRPVDLAAGQYCQGLGRKDERVDHKYLCPVPLGDLAHFRVRAALDQEGSSFPWIFSNTSEKSPTNSTSKSSTPWKRMYSIVARSWQVPIGPRSQRSPIRTRIGGGHLRSSAPPRTPRTAPASAPAGGRCRGRR